MRDLMVIGGGRMGAALVAGLLRAGLVPGSLAVVEKDESRRGDLGLLLPGVSIRSGKPEPSGVTSAVQPPLEPETADGVVLAVKPADAMQACELAERSGARRVLSIMAGVPIRSLETWIGPGPSVLRAMPNTPALVGAGVSALAGSPRASEEDFVWAESLLAAVGTVVRVDEDDLDAVTGLSGSGPAYVFRVVEVLAQAGVRAGLSLETSRVLARETIVGAGRLLADSEEQPETLRAQVTSPGGTTEAGLAVLEARGIAQAFYDAVEAAAERSKQLGGAH
ncbi:MAG: pyrroline-5-carboxylate reductase [Acidimicrobiales bacterium]